MHRPPRDAAARPRTIGSVWSGVLFGIGASAFIDEAVFHQVLHWHHFYDRASLDIGLLSDGLFHAFSWFATIAGLFLLADLRRRRVLHWPAWTGGALLGAGVFQLYDGIVHHLLLRIHQIRYVENVLPYDIVWNVVAIAMIIAGAVIVALTRSSSAVTARDR